MAESPHPGEVQSSVFDAQRMVNLTCYPLMDLDSGCAEALVQHARRELASLGACELMNFLTADGIQCAIDQSQTLAAAAYPSRSEATAYLTAADTGFPADHPRAFTMKSSVRVVGYDQIPRSHAIRQLYEWRPLMHFLARVLGLPELHRYADPMGALNLAVMGDGDALGWHYDQTDFVTSIPLVSAPSGGTFEVHPLIRSTLSENYPAVRSALQGNGKEPLRFAMNPGSLLLFKGRHSLHRVTPITGSRDRIVALLAYDARPGTESSAELKLARYGRSTPLPTPG